MGVPIPEVAHYRSAGGSRTMKRQFTGYISPGKPLAGNNLYLSPGKPLVGNDLTVVAHSRNPYGQSYYEQMYQTTELSRASSSSDSNAKEARPGHNRVAHKPGTKPQCNAIYAVAHGLATGPNVAPTGALTTDPWAIWQPCSF